MELLLWLYLFDHRWLFRIDLSLRLSQYVIIATLLVNAYFPILLIVNSETVKSMVDFYFAFVCLMIVLSSYVLLRKINMIKQNYNFLSRAKVYYGDIDISGFDFILQRHFIRSRTGYVFLLLVLIKSFLLLYGEISYMQNIQDTIWQFYLAISHYTGLYCVGTLLVFLAVKMFAVSTSYFCPKVLMAFSQIAKKNFDEVKLEDD